MRHKLLLALALLLVLTAPASAQPAPASTPPAGFSVEAATRHYLDTLTPAQKARSDVYLEGGYWLQLWEVVYALGVAEHLGTH